MKRNWKHELLGIEGLGLYLGVLLLGYFSSWLHGDTLTWEQWGFVAAGMAGLWLLGGIIIGILEWWLPATDYEEKYRQMREAEEAEERRGIEEGREEQKRNRNRGSP